MVVAATAGAVVAATVVPRLLDEPAEPDPAPKPELVPVEELPLGGAEPLPGGALRTHHAAGDDFQGMSWDRWAGVTDDGYLVRLRYVFDTDTADLGLVDPVSGRTEWLPDAGTGSALTPLRLGADELVFLGDGPGTGSVSVYDRAAGRWSSYEQLSAFDEGGDR